MNNGTFKYIEQMLMDYNKIDDHIARRIAELKYPVVSHETNVGGGRGNKTSKPTERLAITIADDLALSNLRNIQKTIEGVLNDMPETERKVIELYYIEQPRKYTWVGVAQQTNYSERQCRNIRNATFTEIAKRLGMPL